MKVLLSLVLSLSLLASCAATQYQALSRSVEKLYAGTKFCTAFAVNQAMWLTAEHCVDGPVAVLREREVTLIKQDKDKDLALYFDKQGGATPLPLARREAEVGDEVVALGFPRESRTPVTLFGRVMGGEYEEISDKVLVSVLGGPGASGAPVLTTGGKVVGVLVGGSTNQPFLGYYVPLEDIKEFLR